MLALRALKTKRVSGTSAMMWREAGARKHSCEGNEADDCPFVPRSESRVGGRSRMIIRRGGGRCGGRFAILGLKAGVRVEVLKGREEVMVMNSNG